MARIFRPLRGMRGFLHNVRGKGPIPSKKNWMSSQEAWPDENMFSDQRRSFSPRRLSAKHINSITIAVGVAIATIITTITTITIIIIIVIIIIIIMVIVVVNGIVMVIGIVIVISNIIIIIIIIILVVVALAVAAVSASRSSSKSSRSRSPAVIVVAPCDSISGMTRLALQLQPTRPTCPMSRLQGIGPFRV